MLQVNYELLETYFFTRYFHCCYPVFYKSPSKEEFNNMRNLNNRQSCDNEIDNNLLKLIQKQTKYVEDEEYLDEVKKLLFVGATVDKCDDKGDSLLMLSIGKGLYMTFEMLINAGADINYSNKKGNTALWFSLNKSSYGIYKFFDRLLELGCDINKVNNDGKTILDFAYELNNTYCIDKLLDKSKKRILKK